MKEVLKTCTCCGVAKPNTNQHFSWANQAQRKLAARCKKCTLLYKQKPRARQDVGVYVPEPKVSISREKTDRGTVIVRFGDGWKANGAVIRQSSWAGYASGFER